MFLPVSVTSRQPGSEDGDPDLRVCTRHAGTDFIENSRNQVQVARNALKMTATHAMPLNTRTITSSDIRRRPQQRRSLPHRDKQFYPFLRRSPEPDRHSDVSTFNTVEKAEIDVQPYYLYQAGIRLIRTYNIPLQQQTLSPEST